MSKLKSISSGCGRLKPPQAPFDVAVIEVAAAGRVGGTPVDVEPCRPFGEFADYDRRRWHDRSNGMLACTHFGYRQALYLASHAIAQSSHSGGEDCEQRFKLSLASVR